MDKAENIRLIKAQALLPKEKKPYRMPKVSAKKLDNPEPKNEDLQKWFEERREEMTGLCAHCGGVSCKNSDKYYKRSAAHILPKNIFESVKTHPKNFIELCFWAPSCHTMYDNKLLDIMDLNCFHEVIEKFIAIYPDIAKKERKYIPDVLLQYVRNERDI